MKKILSIVVILGISAFSICGCNKEASKSENQSTIEVAPVAEDSQNVQADEELQAKYDELLAKYEELEDYTTYLEQELIRIKAESAMIAHEAGGVIQKTGNQPEGLVPAITENEE